MLLNDIGNVIAAKIATPKVGIMEQVFRAPVKRKVSLFHLNELLRLETFLRYSVLKDRQILNVLINWAI